MDEPQLYSPCPPGHTLPIILRHKANVLWDTALRCPYDSAEFYRQESVAMSNLANAIEDENQ